MATLDGGQLIGRVLRENRVKYCFTINGGHLFPILANLRNNEIKMIHMRHEQATAYAADAYARITGEPGLCAVTAGCGLTNAVTGLCVAGLTGSAVVCISGQHPNTEDHLGSFQEAYGSEVVSSFSKFTKRVTDWSTIEFDLRSAFREAVSPPQGPALIEIPLNILYHRDEENRQRKGARLRLRAKDLNHVVARLRQPLPFHERRAWSSDCLGKSAFSVSSQLLSGLLRG